MRFSTVLDAALLAAAGLLFVVAVIRVVERPQPDGAEGFDGWEDDLAFDRAIGPEDSPYRIVVWMDYQCPACRRLEDEIDLARQQLGDSLTVVYRYYPLTSHPLAFQAALAAECAKHQGRFAEMHAALMADPLTADSLPIGRLSDRAGLHDTGELRACISDPTSPARKAVVEDRRRVKSLNVRGTPAIQIGDRVATGGMTADALVKRLRTEVARSSSRP